MIGNVLSALTRPWRRAREHAEAMELAAEIDLEAVFREMRAELERAEVDELIAAERAAGVTVDVLEPWLRAGGLESARAFFAAARPPAAPEPPLPVAIASPVTALLEQLAAAALPRGADARALLALALRRTPAVA